MLEKRSLDVVLDGLDEGAGALGRDAKPISASRSGSGRRC